MLVHLPWKKGVASHSLAALGEAVFNADIKDSTTALVDADVAASGGVGDSPSARSPVANRPLKIIVASRFIII